MNATPLFSIGLLAALIAARVCAADETLQTRVEWLPKCPSEPPETVEQREKFAVVGALIAAIAPKLIEGAVDSAAEALKAAGQTKTIATTARIAANFYSLTPDADLAVAGSCMVVVRGRFDASAPSPLEWAKNTMEFRTLQRPVVQLETKVVPLRGLKYFQLVPQYLKVEGFEEKSPFFDRKSRAFSITAAFTVPGAAQPFGSAEFLFKDIGENTELKANDERLRTTASLPIAFPSESADVTRAKAKREAEVAPLLLAIDILTPPKPKPFEKAPSVYENSGVVSKAATLCAGIRTLNGQLAKAFQLNDERCAYPIENARSELEAALETSSRSPARITWAQKVCKYEPGDENTGPSCTNRIKDEKPGPTFTYFTTQLTLSETRDGNKFALFLGNALSAAKADVSTALKQKLIPKTQSQLDAEEATARDSRTAVILADLEVTKAEEALADTLLNRRRRRATLRPRALRW